MNKNPLHILLADDDEGDRLLFTVAFSELKIKTVVSTVNDGTELMEWLNKQENSLPYILFLDLNMPSKSGIECLKEIKSNPRLEDVLIAIYSTSENEKDIDETFLNGANVYISKPNDFNLLKQVLEKAVASASKYKEPGMIRENFLLKV
ncbi:MAG: transcriptional regulator [Bacteroidetes bacterium GWE2_39_28]|nr:MAG: transcriptional regulator [Bacteroidetes bacterium GWE2_39_28]OFY15850.1 MAG: transcriptional regulator [Bacteroidetes bacterium GWF2_39_10]OFZ08540.1 MAG: transcriptional regulator [Bacteroidetes bacterium RIFOXYB2_FULL_39_7]OFZ10015.1 MAG: transcriptional regulator [Bacteroidetes bacterium RIFOXYC2_FULL_39_11]HCT93568.1 response regulator [Rikenellaceae bacterium]